MKISILTLLSILSAGNALADSCYTATSAVEGAPRQLCLDNIAYSAYDPQGYRGVLNVRGGNLAGVYRITNVASLSDQQVSFTASRLVDSQSDGICSRTENTYVEIVARHDFLTVIDPSSLHISWSKSVTPDNCHVRPEVTTVSYR